MSVQPIHRFLEEFRREPRRAPAPEPAKDAEREEASPLLPADVPDVDAMIAEAYRRGCEETRQAADKTHEQALAAVRLEAEEALAAERARWVEEESATLVARIGEGFGELESRLAEKTARALRPFLRDAVREQAVEALCETLRRLLHSRPSATLEMAGPEDLLDAVMRRLGGHDGKIAIRVTGEPDIRVVCDETTIETQIALWVRSLALDDA
jgi:hypothetical protein